MNSQYDVGANPFYFFTELAWWFSLIFWTVCSLGALYLLVTYFMGKHDNPYPCEE